MPIEESLNLDVSAAIDAIRSDLGSEIDSLPKRLQDAFADIDIAAMVGELAAELDAIGDRLQAGFENLDVSGAAAAIRDEIGAQIDELPGQLQLGFDGLDVSGAASAVSDGIGAAVDELPRQLELGLADVDARPAAEAIRDDFVPVLDELGTRLQEAFMGLEDSGAFQGLNEAIEDLGETMASLGKTTEDVITGGGGGGSGLGLADVGGIAATIGSAGRNLGDSVTTLGGAPLLAAASLTGAFVKMAGDALDAESATRSFNLRVGDLAEALNRVDVGGFNEDLSTFAIRIGADDDAMRLALAKLVDLSVGSNKTRQEVGALGQEFVALAGYLSVTNPSLGTADQLLQSLPRVLARGGTALANYGIALSVADINQKAVADSGGKAVEELTVFDKAAAGLALTMDQLGPKFDANFTKALEDPKTQLRSLRTAIAETGEAAAGPIIEPLIESLTELQPTLIVVAETIGTLGAAVMSVLGPAVKVVAPFLEDMADIIDDLPEPVVALGVGVLLLGHRFGFAGLAAKAAAINVGTFTVAAGAASRSLLGPVGLVFAAWELSKVLDESIFGGKTDAAKGLGDLLGNTEAFAEQARKVRDEWNETDDFLTEMFLDEFEALTFLGKFNDQAEKNIEVAKRLRDEWSKELNVDQIALLNAVIEKNSNTLSSSAKQAAMFAQFVDSQMTPALVNASGVTKDWTGQEEQLGQAIGEVTDMVAANDAAVALASLSWQGYVANMTDAEGAASRFAGEMAGLSATQGELSDSFITFAQAVKDNGATLDLNTASGRRNDETLRSLITTGATYVGQIYEAEGASQNYADAQAAIRAQLVSVMTALGFTQAEQLKYIALWDKVPRNVETNVVIKISTVFVGASKGEEQKYFDELAESMGEGTDESRKRLAENLYEMTPPEDTKAKTAQDLKDWVNGLSKDLATGLADAGGSAGRAGGAALADGIIDGAVEEIEWNKDRLYEEVGELNRDLADFMARGGDDMMGAYADAVSARARDVLGALRDISDEIISQARFDSDTLAEIFRTFGEQTGVTGGPGEVPLNLDINKLAAGFSSGGVGFEEASRRAYEAMSKGLIDSVDLSMIIAKMIELYIEAANKTGNPSFVNGIPTRVVIDEKTGLGKFVRASQGGIAGVGAGVMFNEPDAGGEAFIPLAPDRRARATAILGDVASRFGYSLISRSGAVSVPASSPLGGGSLERIASLLESLPERLPRALSVSAPIDNVSYGDAYDVSQRVVANVQRTLAGIGASVSTRQGRR